MLKNKEVPFNVRKISYNANSFITGENNPQNSTSHSQGFFNRDLKKKTLNFDA